MDLTGWLETALPPLLPAFLHERRWFGGKSRPIREAALEDLAWLDGPRAPSALAIVVLRYEDGAREKYAMVVSFVAEPGDLPVVGQVADSGPHAWAVESAVDAGPALALLAGLASGEPLPTRAAGRVIFGDAGQPVRAIVGASEPPAIKPVGTEQSNTSLRLARALVFKLFRKLEAGENPELEISRFLTTRTTFRAMPVLQGSLTYEPAHGQASTLGVVQNWVENQGDGWSYVVDRLRSGSDTLSAEIYTLGVVTAEFHHAMASDASVAAFAPEPVTDADVAEWTRALEAGAARARDLVAKAAPDWPPDAQRLAEALLAIDSPSALVPEAPAVSGDGGFAKIRIHGDYHLGQTLKTDSGFVLIDFEGEPARPLAERRLTHAALKDVAGMLRSFDYAAETVRRERGDTSRGAALAAALRDAYLDGYLSTAQTRGAAFVPRDRDAVDRWIARFELDKALYEVDYEINHRPAWVHIPLQGIVRILGARSGRRGR